MSRSAPISAREARELLKVGVRASASELRRAFLEAAKTAHPDRPGGSTDAFRRVTEAYQRLQDGRAAAERIVQPPARTDRAPGIVEVPPALAVQGGAFEHTLSDGRRVRITLPAGLRTGDIVRVGGEAMQVTLGADPALQVRGDDVWLNVEVDPRTLAEGGRVTLETPLGRRIVWITRKAAERGLVRLIGQGLPARGGHAEGHLFLRLAARRGETQSAAGRLLRRFAAAWAA